MRYYLLIQGSHVLLCCWMMLLAVATTMLSVASAAEASWGTPHDKVIALNGSNLQSSIDDPANPLWLLKYYAPWCGHCKKLAPVLDKVAPAVKGQLAIGKIDCTTDKKTCDAQNVRGYPTLKFALDGQIYDYPGGRSADDIIGFAEKMNRPALQDVASVADVYNFARSQTESGVVFVAYWPQKEAEESMVSQVFAQVARKQRAIDYFLKLSSTATDLADAAVPQHDASQPFVCRMEEHIAPVCVTDTTSMTSESLLEFVKQHNFATVSKLGPHNFHKLGRSGRPLLIGVVESANQAQLSDTKKVLLDYATNGVHRESYYFGWLDAKQWSKFLEQFNAQASPQVFILNVPDKAFWQNATYGLNVADFVAAVQDGTIPQGTAGSQGVAGFMHKIYNLMVEYRPWSVIVVVLLVITVAVLIASLVSPGGDYDYAPDPHLTDPLQGDDDDDEPTKEQAQESKKDK